MKHLPLHTLVLLSVFLHSGSCADGDGRCVPLFVRDGETATINCSLPDSDQDGVYMFRRGDTSSSGRETVLYYYRDGTLTPEPRYRGRVETNEVLGNFSVSIHNVSVRDGGVYWCRFNKLDVFTDSELTCLLGLVEIIPARGASLHLIYPPVIGLLLLFILILVLVTQCRDRGSHTLKQQQPSTGVYEVMHGRTIRSLDNTAYQSSQRRALNDSR